MHELNIQASDTVQMIFNKVVWLVSTIVGVVLSAIGYPKQVLVFIVTLIVIDILTKQYSIVVINYGKFSIKVYLKAWLERKLTSRQLKNGLGVKGILYLPLLYMAHQSSIHEQIIGGSIISNTIYTALMIIECSSIVENFIDCGYTELLPILKFFKKKQESIEK